MLTIICAIPVLLCMFPFRFWVAINRLGPGVLAATLRGAGHIFALDVVSTFLAAAAVYWAAHARFPNAWIYSFTPIDLNGDICAFVVAISALILLRANERERFDDICRWGERGGVIAWLHRQDALNAIRFEPSSTAGGPGDRGEGA